MRGLIEAAAQGRMLAVATTTCRPTVEALTQALFGKPADAVLDTISAGAEAATRKPAPDVCRLALERLGIAAADAVAFEDSLNGRPSAQAAGLSGVVAAGRQA